MTTNSNIVDRVVERLKAQPIGGLITEEDLHDIVKQAIPKAFFEERYDPKDTSSYNRNKLPPIIVVAMQEALQAHAKQAIDNWIKENPQIMLDYWKKVCDDKLLKYVNDIMDQRATGAITTALRGMVQEMNNDRQRAGLPMLNYYF